MTTRTENVVKNFVTAMMVVAIATPAFAQMSPNVLGQSDRKLKTDVEIQQEQDREHGFKSGLSKIPDAKGKVDPWGNVRSAPTPSGQTQARPAPK
jgi:hypothetical protein